MYQLVYNVELLLITAFFGSEYDESCHEVKEKQTKNSLCQIWQLNLYMNSLTQSREYEGKKKGCTLMSCHGFVEEEAYINRKNKW